MRPASNLYAYQKLVDQLVSPNQEPTVALGTVAEDDVPGELTPQTVDDLRERWSKLTDTHQFFGMLRTLKLSRQQAVRMIGQDYAWKLDPSAVMAMFQGASASGQPIMCFVGNRGCIQIHSGPVKSVSPMGPWINIFDETFHLHLRGDHIAEAWAVRKPTKDGHVTSLEAYDADGKMIIQFFGKRHEGETERADWRSLAESLPRVAEQSAA